MKRILLFLSLLILPATITSAHLGETWAQCAARYGKPVMSSKCHGVYQKDGVRIEITFNGLSDDDLSDDAANRGMARHNGAAAATAVEVNYTKLAEDGYFTEAEVNLLLNANAGPESSLGDKAWVEDRRKHVRQDLLRADNLAKAKIYWTFAGDTKAARRIDISLSDRPYEKHSSSSSDATPAIEKGF